MLLFLSLPVCDNAISSFFYPDHSHCSFSSIFILFFCPGNFLNLFKMSLCVLRKLQSACTHLYSLSVTDYSVWMMMHIKVVLVFDCIRSSCIMHGFNWCRSAAVDQGGGVECTQIRIRTGCTAKSIFMQKFSEKIVNKRNQTQSKYCKQQRAEFRYISGIISPSLFWHKINQTKIISFTLFKILEHIKIRFDY